MTFAVLILLAVLDKWPELGYGTTAKVLPYLQTDPARYQCGTVPATHPLCMDWTEQQWAAHYPNVNQRTTAKSKCVPCFNKVFCKKDASGNELPLKQWK